MVKRFFIILMATLFCIQAFSQIEYGYERPKSSDDAWKFGVNALVTYDWINQPIGMDKRFNYKLGVSGEKHLIYNIYFRPVLNFWKKSCEATMTNSFHDKINGYFADFEATIELKFGDERKQKGLIIYLAPFFSYGMWGQSERTILDKESEKYNQPFKYETFADNVYKREDVGFVLGAGYDLNKHWELNLNYMIGYYNFGYTANYRWRSWQFGITYFF